MPSSGLDARLPHPPIAKMLNSDPSAAAVPKSTAKSTAKKPRRTAERILEVTLDLFNRFGEPNVSTTLIRPS